MNDDVDTSTNGHASQDSSEDSGGCFVIAPIGDSGSDNRQRTENLKEYVIKPVLEGEIGLDVEIAHDIDEPGNINRQVMEKLFNAELVVADLTGHNPNVMYELAIRHATGEPVVTIARKGTTPPFDIGPQRTKFYELEFGGAEDFKDTLRASAKEALSEDHQPDNPVQQVREGFTLDKVLEGKFEQLTGEGEKDVAGILKQLLTRIENLESQVTAQRRSMSPWSKARQALSETRDRDSRFEEKSTPLKRFFRSGESRYVLEGNPETIGRAFKEAFSNHLVPIASDVTHSRIEKGEKPRTGLLFVEHDADEERLNKVVEEAAKAVGVDVIEITHASSP